MHIKKTIGGWRICLVFTCHPYKNVTETIPPNSSALVFVPLTDGTTEHKEIGSGTYTYMIEIGEI